MRSGAEVGGTFSALHGVRDPEEVVEPYEMTLSGAGIGGRRLWGERVKADLMRRYPEAVRFVVLAGSCYREFLVPALEEAGHVVDVPMRGLGIGQQLVWLMRRSGEGAAP